MTSEITIPTHPAEALATTSPVFQTAFDVLLYNLSDTSKRQYQHTFNLWLAWCEDNEVHNMAISAQNLIAFLEASDISHSTRKGRLSHLRKLLETLKAQVPDNAQISAYYDQVKLLKVKRSSEEQASSREKHALKAKQVHDAFNVWAEAKPRHVRNRAILAVLLYCGLRRSECAALQWRDIDLEEQLLTVRHGKGDKERVIPILGGSEHLIEWKALVGHRHYVFCSINRHDQLNPDDEPLSTSGIYRVMKQTGAVIGVDIAPHDARRTLITNGLTTGASVADMQFIAGHANPQTTLA